MINLLDKILEIFEIIPDKRAGDILIRRFGLGCKKETLESIGRSYGVTRERIRQIERNIFRKIEKRGILEKLSPEISLVKNYLKSYGGLKKEDVLIDDLAKKALLEEKIKAGFSPKNIDGLNFRNVDQAKGILFLFLNLGREFSRYSGDREIHPVWALNKESIEKAKTFLANLTRFLEGRDQTISEEELLDLIKRQGSKISQKEISSYLESSRLINKNPLGHYGLTRWVDITPKGMGDRAWLVLRQAGRPLHFLEITRRIDQLFSDSRKPYAPTVHNALIRDPRFILVGRGVYALKGWDYHPGPTLEVIREVIQERGPQTKEEILSVIQQKKLVKTTTILAYLQNKKYFRRNKDGKYEMVKR